MSEGTAAAGAAAPATGATSTSANIQVTIKVRPLIQREKEAKMPKLWRVMENTIQLIDSSATASDQRFTFDHIFDEETTTADMFNKIAKPIVDATLKGFNGTIFAYGQTSSGKTHTMLGSENQPGIMMLAVREIFNEIEQLRDRQFLLRVGYIEIYNEKVFDLLDSSNADLKISEKTRGEVTVNHKECIVRNEEVIMELLAQGNKERKTGGTKMNERSSRSHTIFRIIIESSVSRENGCGDEDADDQAVQTSYLNLVDLAGSERAVQTGATGSRLQEAANINRSLLSLSLVISQLAKEANQSVPFVNYRNSKLTRILAASLGGNAMTAIICNVTPAALEETMTTLNFGTSAKKIQNKPQVNELCSNEVYMKRLTREIKRLTEELEEQKLKASAQAETDRLRERLFERQSQILRAKPSGTVAANQLRRRTWAPSLPSSSGAGDTSLLMAAPYVGGGGGGGHVSRILPPGHRTQHSLAAQLHQPAPIIAAHQSTPNSAGAATDFDAANQSHFEFDTNVLSSSIFDEAARTPLKFLPVNAIVQRARGSALAPARHPPQPQSLLQLPRSHSNPAMQSPASGGASLSRLAAQLSTPREFQSARFERHEPVSPATAQRQLASSLETELTDLRHFTRLESKATASSEAERTELAEMRERMEAMQQQLQLHREEHEELIMWRTGLMSVCSDAGSGKADEEARVAEVEEKLSTALAEITSLQQQVAAAQSEQSVAEQLGVQLSAELQTTVAAHQRELVAARREADTAQRSVHDQLTADAAAARKAAAHAESLRCSIEYEFEQFRAHSKRREQELLERLDDPLAQPDVLQATIGTLKESLRTAETALWSQQERCTAMTEATATAEAQLAELQAELQAAKLAQKAAAEQVMADIGAAVADCRAEMERQFEERRREAVESAEREFQVQLSVQMKAELDAAMEKAAVDREAAVQAVRAELEALIAERERLAAVELAEKMAAAETHRLETIEAIESAAKDARNEVSKAHEDAIVAIRTALESEDAERERLAAADRDEQLSAVQAELATAQAAQQAAASQADRDRSETAHLRAEMRQLQSDYEELSQQLMDAVQEPSAEQQDIVDGLRKQCEAQTVELQTMRTEREQLDSRVLELQQQTADLATQREQIASLEAATAQLQQQLADSRERYLEVCDKLAELEPLRAINDILETSVAEQREQIAKLSESLQAHAAQAAHSDTAACAMAVIVNHQGDRSSNRGEPNAALIASIAAHCVSDKIVPTSSALGAAQLQQLHDLVCAEFDAQLTQLHDLHQQLSDQSLHFERLELQYDGLMFDLRQQLNETDAQLAAISDQYANSADIDVPDSAALQELHELRARCADLAQQQRAAEAEHTRLELLGHEAASERDETHKAFEATIAAKLDLEERCSGLAAAEHELRSAAREREHDLQTVQRQLATAEQRLSDERAELTALQGREVQLGDELCRSQAQLQQATDDLGARTGELRQSQLDCANVQAQLDAVTERCEAMQQQLDRLLAEKNDLEVVVENNRAVLEQAELACTSMRETMLGMASIERLQEEMDALRADKEQLADQHGEACRTIERQRKELAAFEASLGEEREECARELAGKLHEAEERLAQQEQMAAQRVAEAQELSDKLAAASEQLTEAAKLKEDLQRLQELHVVVSDELQMVRKTASMGAEESDDLQAKNSQLTNELQQLRDAAKKSAEENTISANELRSLRDASASETQAKNDALQQLTTANEANTKLQHEAQNSQRRLDELLQKLRDNENAFSAASAELAEARAQLDELSAQNAQHTKMTTNQRQQCSDLQLQLARSELATKELRDTADQQAQEIQYLIPLRQKYDALRTEFDALRQQPAATAAAEAQLTATIAQLTAVQQHNSDLQLAHDRHKSLLATAQQQHERLQSEHSATSEQMRAEHRSQIAHYVEQLSRSTTDLHDLRSRHRSEQSFNEKELKINELETHLQRLHSEQQARLQQNDALTNRNQHLARELDELRARLQSDRKSRRRSAHDDLRPTLAAANAPAPPPTCVAQTQTGDADGARCACAEMDARIKSLVREAVIKDCHITRLKMESKSSPLTAENAELRRAMQKATDDAVAWHTESGELKRLIAQHEHTVQRMRAALAAASAQAPKASEARGIAVDREQQTEAASTVNGSALVAQEVHFQLQQELAQMANKYRQAKGVCQMRKVEIERLEREKAAARSSDGSSNSTTKVNRDQQTDAIADEARTEQEAVLQREVAVLSTKYKQAKQLLLMYKDTAERLTKEQAAQLTTTNGDVAALNGCATKEKENVPTNNSGGGSSSNSSGSNRSMLTAAGGDLKQMALEMRRLEAENQALRARSTLQSNNCSQQQQQPSSSDDVDRLKGIIDDMEKEIKTIRDKYDALKHVLMARNRQIQFLEAERAVPKK